MTNPSIAEIEAMTDDQRLDLVAEIIADALIEIDRREMAAQQAAAEAAA